MKYLLFVLLVLLLVSCSFVNLTSEMTSALIPTENRDVPTRQAEETPDVSVVATSTPAAYRADLPDLGPAPELNNQVWLNTDTELRLSNLRGQVVLLEMWTFG